MDQPRIYVSTGLMRVSTLEAADSLVEKGVLALELSGGVPDPAIAEVVKGLFLRGIRLQPHNYFPAPAESFVFNLSAPAASDRDRSIAFAMAAVDMAVLCGASRYSFHAGFLGTPRVQDLGRPWGAVEQLPLTEGIAIFQESVLILHEYAQSRGIRLLVENNVLTEGTASSNGTDVLLMTSPEGIARVMAGLPDDVQLLLDVAHLKVSARTLHFSAPEAMSFLSELVGGYHLSDNDGKSDSNDPVQEDSWFWDLLSDQSEFATLEVVSSGAVSIVDQVDMCARRWTKRD